MTQVSQNAIQNASIKRFKIHRTSPEVSRKIVAFEEIIRAENIKSSREITKLLSIPNSTMQTWREQKMAKWAMDDEINMFFSTPAGSSLLFRIVLAIMYNNKCGASGICGVQESLHNSGLDKYVATSIGALQKFWLRCEDSILAFGEQWEQKLAKKMKTKKITVILDEMFRKRKPCLVAIEAVSNYILLEKFTEDRTSATWKKELEDVTKELPITIGQVTSDLCGAIRSLAKEYGANHSPDIFHGQYEISKATSGALNSQERAAERALNEAEENVKKITNKPCRIILEEKQKQQEDQEMVVISRDILKIRYEERKKRREKTQEAKRELGKIYHPINLETGKMQSGEIIEKKFEEQFKIIDKNVESAGLIESSKDRVEKAKRAFALMVVFMKKFLIIFAATILNMQLNAEQEIFFKEVVFPLCYLNMIWRRLSKKEKEKLDKLLKNLQKKLQEETWTEDFKKTIMEQGKELAEAFQRSSSCVEGRNGMLSLLMHRFHYLGPKTLKVLSIVHNFGVKRKDDGSTAAERFFGSKHSELFDYLVENVKIPGKPQLQIRKKDKMVA